MATHVMETRSKVNICKVAASSFHDRFQPVMNSNNKSNGKEKKHFLDSSFEQLKLEDENRVETSEEEENGDEEEELEGGEDAAEYIRSGKVKRKACVCVHRDLYPSHDKIEPGSILGHRIEQSNENLVKSAEPPVITETKRERTEKYAKFTYDKKQKRPSTNQIEKKSREKTANAANRTTTTSTPSAASVVNIKNNVQSTEFRANANSYRTTSTNPLNLSSSERAAAMKTFTVIEYVICEDGGVGTLAVDCDGKAIAFVGSESLKTLADGGRPFINSALPYLLHSSSDGNSKRGIPSNNSYGIHAQNRTIPCTWSKGRKYLENIQKVYEPVVAKIKNYSRIYFPNQTKFESEEPSFGTDDMLCINSPPRCVKCVNCTGFKLVGAVHSDFHLDGENNVNRCCKVYVTGDFNWKCRHLLVLWEPELIIQLPPGTICFYGSSVWTHGNINALDIWTPEEAQEKLHLASPYTQEMSDADEALEVRYSGVTFNQGSTVDQQIKASLRADDGKVGETLALPNFLDAWTTFEC